MGTEIQVILQRAAGKGIPQIRGNSSPTIPAQGDTEGTHQLLSVESASFFVEVVERRNPRGPYKGKHKNSPQTFFF